MAEWTQTTLGAIVAKEGFGLVDGPFGSNLPASSYTESGIPIIRGSNLTLGTSRFRADDFVFVSHDTAERLARSLCRPFDIVFTKKGTLGQTGLIPEGGLYDLYLLSSNQMKLTVDRRIADPLFIYYFVSSPASTEKIIRDSEATGVPKTNVTYLREFSIALPPLPEQRAIAHILGTLDDKIELNRRMNETLEAIARALFKSWFVDFVPVRAKMESRDPGLPKHIADLFPNSFEDSELGEIPKKWRVEEVGNIAEINARTLSRTDALDLIDYIEISEVIRGEIANVARYKTGTEPSRARRRLSHGDTVLSTVRPDREAHFLCLNPPKTFIASTGFAVLTPREGDWAFLYTALTRREIGEELGRLADGGAYPAVRPETMGSLRVVVPAHRRIYVAFEKLARPLLERSAQNRAEGKTLAALRDTLLSKLISGDLRIKDAERFMVGAA